MIITQAQVDAGRRALSARSGRGNRPNYQDFNIRPISEEWRAWDRRPALRTAVCNVAYIWRDSEPVDRFGPMPAKFAERRCELRDHGLILPASAPVWATEPYRVWEEADIATAATGDPTALAAWHVIMTIPASVRANLWSALVTGFVRREITARGAITAWAIHALQGENGVWIEKPHAHLIVTGRYWRQDHRLGDRHPAMIGSYNARNRLAAIWRNRCGTTRLIGLPS